MIYLILVNITLTVCYLLYRIFFRRLTFFQWNRLYLLSALVVSLIIPIGLFVDISSNRFIEEQLPTIDISSLMMDELTLGANKQHTVSLTEGIHAVYWIGVALAIAWLIFRFIHVMAIMKKKQSEFSFAFFHRVVLGEKVQGNQSIVAHENVHVEQGHSYDVLLLEIAKAFNWFNPIFHIYLRELKFQHECIADELCSVDKVAYAQLLVAQAMQVDQIHFLHEFSNKSILKNRIAMLFKDKSKNKYKFLYFSIAPVILLAVLSTLVFNTSKAKNIVSDIETKVEGTTLDNMGKQLLEPIERDVINDKADKQVKLKGVEKLTEIQDTTRLFTAVEVSPEPIGGFDAFRRWFGSNYNYPKDAAEAKVNGQVVTSFVVETDGTLSDIKVIKDLGHGTGQAAVDLLKRSKKWMPGIQNGRKVRVAYTFPISLNADPVAAKITSKEKVPSGSFQSNSDAAEDKVFTAVEVNPEPVGGMTNFRRWIGSNYKYPQAAIDASVKGLIVVSFIVETDGALSNFKVVKDLGHGTGEATLDVLRQAENWRPAVQNGKKVRVAYTLPLTLNIST